MGHIINPVSQRLGYSNFWNSNWSLSGSASNSNYSYVASENILLSALLRKLFLYSTRRLFGKGIVFVGFKILRAFSKVILVLEIRVKQLPALYRSLNTSFFNVLGLKAAKQRICTKLLQIKKAKYLQKKQSTINSAVRKSVEATLLKRSSKLKFIKRTTKLTKYNSNITAPDLWSYQWSNIIVSLHVKKRIKNLKIGALLNKRKLVVKEFLRYVLVSRWLSSLRIFILSNLRKFYENLPNVEVLVSLTSNSSLSAAFVAKYLTTRLLQKFPLRRLITLLVRQLKVAYDSAIIHGFKIACNGRFERRGRATHTWKVLGKTPRSDIKTYVDYAIMLPVLTNSICAIKVWLTRKDQSEKLLLL